MAELLPQVIPVDELKSTTQPVQTNDAEIKMAIKDVAEAEPPEDAFKGDDEIIKAEIQEELDKEEEEVKIVPKEIQPDEEVFKDAKPKKKPKRQISDSQREHLAQARKKALEVRRRKAQEKKLAQQQERRAKAKAKKEAKNLNTVHNPMESESEEEEPVKVKTVKTHAIEDLDEDLLIAIQEKAIEKYEVKRKARKQKKQKEQEEKQKEQAIHHAVSKAVKPQDPDDMWSVCFA